MTAVAPPPSVETSSRSSWRSANGEQAGLRSTSDENVTPMFLPRKSASRTESSSSVNTSVASTARPIPTISKNGTTNGVVHAGSGRGWVITKRPPKSPWAAATKSQPTSGISNGGTHSATTTGSQDKSTVSTMHEQSAVLPSQHMNQGQQASQHQQQSGARASANRTTSNESQAILVLLPMNGTFERKTIHVPGYPDNLRIGRQTNAKTVPAPTNGYFDSKVLSRQHAEIWADRQGKVWIKDIKSSNGTFVNGQRLSAENRDSEPHELRDQDILELGIDIVSEDQETVVHHKVAARVEHAGFLGSSTNVLDLNFGDIDPMLGGGMMGSSLNQNAAQLRGRSQGSLSSGRFSAGTPSVASSSINAVGQQRHMSLWLNPISIEQIVKRLSSDLRDAKSQSTQLRKTDAFFDTLLKGEDVASNEPEPEPSPPPSNASPSKPDSKIRLSEPPAPPPQQPLPQKPENSQTTPDEPQLNSLLTRSDTERPMFTDASPRADSHKQLASVVEALAKAKRELISQGGRMRNLESALIAERSARELAEEKAKRLERGSKEKRKSSAPAKEYHEDAECDSDEIEDFLLPAEAIGKLVKPDLGGEESATKLKQKMDRMVLEMDDMKKSLAAYKQRAEVAEEERRKTLAEMVEQIRQNEPTKEQEKKLKRSLESKDEVQRPSESPATSTKHSKQKNGISVKAPCSVEAMMEQAGVQAGKPLGRHEIAALEQAMSAMLVRPPASGSTRKFGALRHDQLIQSAPYASIFGVVVIGMGLMVFLNGWQKLER